MMRFAALSFFAIVLALVAVSTNSQEATCATQTAELQSSQTIAQATMQLQQAILEQLQTCQQEGATDCPIDVETEKENIASACEIADGQTYLPVVEWTCDNDNTNTKTTLEVNYAACLGADCSAEEITETWDALLNNVTATANLVLQQGGVTCEASVSGAMGMLFQSSLAVLMVLGSAMVMMG